MSILPFAKQFYALASDPATSEDLLNIYAEPLPPGARSGMIARSTPGLVPDFVVGSGPLLEMDGTLSGIQYYVSGTHLYRVQFAIPTNIVTDLGDIGPIPPPAAPGIPAKIITIAVGALQVAVCNPPNGFYCNHTATSVTQITDSVFTGFGADSVTYMDGFFLWAIANTIFASALLDASTYPALNFTTADSVPSGIQRLMTLGSDVWALGYNTIAIYYNAGIPNFPFVPRSGGVLNKGCRNAATARICDGSLFWIGTDAKVYRNSGYRAVPVSTFAVEEWMRIHADFENVDALSYIQSGHEFYMLNFFVAGGSPAASLSLDVTTNLWHRRASTADGTGAYRGMRAANRGEIALIGDRTSGQIFHLDQTVPTDDGVPVLRWGILQPIWGDGKRVFMSRLELELEMGASENTPVVSLDYSDDGGFTYSALRTANTGPTGVRTGRVFWTRLGNFRQRVLRFSFTDRLSIYGIDPTLEKGL